MNTATRIDPLVERRLSATLADCVISDMAHQDSRFRSGDISRHAGATLISTDGSTRLLVTFRGNEVCVAASRPASHRATINSADALAHHIESLRRLHVALERMINRAAIEGNQS